MGGQTLTEAANGSETVFLKRASLCYKLLMSHSEVNVSVFAAAAHQYLQLSFISNVIISAVTGLQTMFDRSTASVFSPRSIPVARQRSFQTALIGSF